MKSIHILGVSTLLAILLVASVGATSISVDKHEFGSNEEIQYHVTHLVDGVNYVQKTTIVQHLSGDLRTAIGINPVAWPFAHEKDVFKMMNEGTLYNEVYIGHWWPSETKQGYQDFHVFDKSDDNGKWSRTVSTETDETGTYHSTWLNRVAPGTKTVTSTFSVEGTKVSGPSDFDGNTSFWTTSPADVKVEWFDNGVLADTEEFTIAPIEGAYFVATPDVSKVGDKVKFQLIPASGKTVKSAWWSFDATNHLQTWNSRNIDPAFFYPAWAKGYQSPQVKITYTDGSTETVTRENDIRIISDRIPRSRFFKNIDY
jgi:hypothetical protein